MFKGRVRRIAFLLGGLYVAVPMVVLIALTYAFAASGHSSAGVNTIVIVLGVAWFIFSFVVGLGLSVRRWHDLNQSGWLTLLQLVPFVNFICWLIQLIAPGTPGPNNYGNQPGPSLDVKPVLFGEGGSAVPAQPSAPAAPSLTAQPAASPASEQPSMPAQPQPPAPPAPAEPSNPDQPPSQ